MKAPVCGSIVLVTESKVPLPNSMGGVACLLQVLWQNPHISSQASRHEVLDIHVLPPYSDITTVKY